ncbi:MAG: hypothetical protein HY081_06610 [Gammaproteobacteria bacterium]|nr:hypothetical protein [Gammaproteobacteria bacterium]
MLNRRFKNTHPCFDVSAATCTIPHQPPKIIHQHGAFGAAQRSLGVRKTACISVVSHDLVVGMTIALRALRIDLNTKTIRRIPTGASMATRRIGQRRPFARERPHADGRFLF